ncbi:MAG: tetratricopeptide repeat protein, partial [Saprospiraceae bacterium]
GTKDRDALIENTLALKPIDLNDCELPRKFIEIFKEIEPLYMSGKYDKVLEKLDEIENEDDGLKFCLQAFCFYNLKNYKEAEIYYLRAIEKGIVDTLNFLAHLYLAQGKQTEAETYYLQAIEKGDVRAMNNLAIMYKSQGKQKKAETYYLQAIAKGDVTAMFNLAYLYDEQGKQTEAETYYLQAIEKGDVTAIYNLACLYIEQGKQKEAETYYLQAIEKGNVPALNNLAWLYYDLNIHPKHALEYMTQVMEEAQGESYLRNLLVIEIWNGRFEKIPEKIDRIIQNAKGEALDGFLLELLNLSQIQLVLSLFESEQYSKILRERYELIFYASLILAGRTEDNLLLRIPSEVLPTVEDIVAKVKEKQAFYAKKQ